MGNERGFLLNHKPYERREFLNRRNAAFTALAIPDIPVERGIFEDSTVGVYKANTHSQSDSATVEKVDRLTSRQRAEMNFYKKWLGTEFMCDWMPLWGRKWKPIRKSIFGSSSPWKKDDGSYDTVGHKKYNSRAFWYHLATIPLFAGLAASGIISGLSGGVLILGSIYLCIWLRYIRLKKISEGVW